MKNNFKDSCTTLFKSIYDTNALFERRKNSFLIPILILIATLLLSSLPSYFSSLSMDGKAIMKSFPGVDVALEEFFESSLDCNVENAKLVCDENAEKVNAVYGDTIKYTVIANNASLALPTKVEFDSKKDTDNLIYFTSTNIRIRYTQRDYINEKVNTYEIMGNYSKLEGWDFKQIGQEISSNKEVASSKIQDFMLNTYSSTLNVSLAVNLVMSALSLLMLILVATFIIRSPSFFKFKKGLKIRESLKITLTAALPIVVISVLLDFMGLNFNMMFGFLFICRIMYIYFKYIYSKKNNIFVKLYEETKEERYDI